MDALLELRDFSLDYATQGATVHALRGVSFSVGRGEIVGVVGESGCGKSSLVSAVLRLLPINASTRGEVFFNGSDLHALTESQMRALRGTNISVVFQEPMRTHNPVLTIGKQMVDIQYRTKISRVEKLNRAAAMLTKVGIPDAKRQLRQHPHQLSGGMLQRISIAMALLSQPELLVADEPTTALDATSEVQIIDLLRELQSDYGCAVLFVSHHLGVVAELCTRVAVMYAGEVVEFGLASEVFNQPKHPYTRRLLECNPSAATPHAGRLPVIAGEVPDLRQLPNGCAFAPRCDATLAKCTTSSPPTFATNERRVACWLVDTDAARAET